MPLHPEVLAALDVAKSNCKIQISQLPKAASSQSRKEELERQHDALHRAATRHLLNDAAKAAVRDAIAAAQARKSELEAMPSNSTLASLLKHVNRKIAALKSALGS